MKRWTRGPYKRSRTLEQRFWAFVHPEPNSGCYLWSGASDPRGYGQLRVDGSSIRASRLALRIAGVEIPDGMYVLHKCDNPPCVNPEHLFVGSQADNSADKISKGRARHGSLRGEAVSSSKLTTEDVLWISQSEASARALAMLFEVNKDTIDGIRQKRRWKHLFEEAAD